MPQRLAVAGPERHHAALRVAREDEARRRGQYARRGAGAKLVGPLDLTGLIIDGFENALAPHAIIGAGPTERAVGGLIEVDAVTRMRADDEEAGLRIETGRAIVSKSAFIGRD